MWFVRNGPIRLLLQIVVAVVLMLDLMKIVKTAVEWLFVRNGGTVVSLLLICPRWTGLGVARIGLRHWWCVRHALFWALQWNTFRIVRPSLEILLTAFRIHNTTVVSAAGVIHILWQSHPLNFWVGALTSLAIGLRLLMLVLVVLLIYVLLSHLLILLLKTSCRQLLL